MSRRTTSSSSSSSSRGGDARAAEAEETTSSKSVLPTLVGDSNFHVWELRVQNLFYAEDCLAFYNAAQFDKDSDIPGESKGECDIGGISDKTRRKIWFKLSDSLCPEILVKTDSSSVKLGDVVSLLREIRKMFYRNSAYMRSHLKNKLHSVRLDDFNSVEGLITFIETISKRLTTCGRPVIEEDKIHYLLDALPDAYEGFKTTLMMPAAENIRWLQVVEMLREIAVNPQLPGTTAISRKNRDVVMQTDDKPRPQGNHQRRNNKKNSNNNKTAADDDKSNRPLCRNFAKGFCKNGSKCPLDTQKLKLIRAQAKAEMTINKKTRAISAPIASAAITPSANASRRKMTKPGKEMVKALAATKTRSTNRMMMGSLLLPPSTPSGQPMRSR